MPKARDKGAVDEVDFEDRPADVEVFQEVQHFGRYWKHLGQELGVVTEILDIIEQDYRAGGMREMTFQTLLAWKREKTSNATVKTLAKHLKNAERKDLADKILHMFLVRKDDVSRRGSLGEDEQMIKTLNGVKAPRDEKRHLREKVATQLTSRYRRFALKGLPWKDQDDIPLDDYYVDLNVMQQHGTGGNKSLKSTQFEELFSGGPGEKKQAQRILVEGAPGYGKTTFALKLCYDYAQKQPYMHHFNLVFYLPLRHFTGDWRKILVRSAGLDEKECDTLLAVLNTKNKPILLILDGYDELSEEHKKTVLPIIRGTLFPRLTVIVTSRSGVFPGSSGEDGSTDFPDDVTDHMQWGQRLKLTGVTEDKQEQFIEKHFKNLQEEKKTEVLGQLQQMKENKMLESGFLECPLFLLITILLLTEQETVEEQQFQTKTDLYKQICNFIMKRHAAKQGYSSASELDLFAKSENSGYVKLMTQFSTFSFKALQTKRLSFSKQDVLENALLEADETTVTQITDMGFLITTTDENDTSEETVYEPVHKSLMEFAAAYGLWIMARDGSDDGQWHDQVALIRPQRTSAESLIFPFLAGLMGEEPGTLFQGLREHEDEYLHNFDLLWSTLLEMHMTPSVLSSLTPFLPVEWNLSWYNASSQKCKDVLHHGINTGKIKQLRWNIEHTGSLPDDVQVDKLIVETFQLMPPLPVIQCSNFSCAELCFHLNFTYYKTTDDWHNLLSHLSSIPCEKLSFTFYDSVPFFLPMIHSAVTGGRFSNSHFHRIECHVEEKGCLVDVMKLVEVTEVEMLELSLNVAPATSNSATSCHNQCKDQDCQTQWQQQIDDMFISIAKNSHLTNFILRNKTSHGFTIHWEDLCDSNAVTSKMFWFEGIKILNYHEALQELNNQHLLPIYQDSTNNKELRCSVFVTNESLQECVKLLRSLSSIKNQTVSLCLYFPYSFMDRSDSNDSEQSQLKETQMHVTHTLTKLVEMEIVSTIEICINHGPAPDMKNQESELLLQQQLDEIVACSAKSSHLTRFIFKNNTGNSFTIDLDRLCDNGDKLWNTVWLEGVKIECIRGARETLEIQKPTVVCQYKKMDSSEPWCYFAATDETLEEWLIMLSHIFSAQYQDVSFFFFGYPYFLSYIYFYLTQIQKIECHLKEKQCHAVDTILELLTRDKSEILELHLNSPPSPPSSPSVLCNDDCSDLGCDWISQKQINTLLVSAAKAQKLTNFVLKNKTSVCYSINLEEICNTDKQLRKTVMLEGVKVASMQIEMDSSIEIEECISAEDDTSSSMLYDTFLKSFRFNLLPQIQSSEDTHIQNLEEESLRPASSTSSDNAQPIDIYAASVDVESGSNQVTSDVAVLQIRTSSTESLDTEDENKQTDQENNDHNQYHHDVSNDRSRSVIRSQPASSNPVQSRSRSESPTARTPLLPKDSSHETDSGCCNCCCIS